MSESESFARLLGATLAIGILPGALATLAWKPRPSLTVLETIGFGIGISFGLVELLTVLAIAVHLSPAIILAMLGAGCVAMAAPVLYRRPRTVVFHLDECILVLVLVVLGVFLYRIGSPVEWYEDQVPVAIVRRLSALSAPRLDDIYLAPGIVYTYPFPGTHYFMALIARLSDLDPLFVYHKLRFFWGPAALVMLYLLARAAFGSVSLACGTAITAAVLLFSGAFGMVPGFQSGWGQLMPFSHASDVAMTVLLPALIVLACGYLLAGPAREKAFFLASTAALTLMLTIVHIREVVQMAGYAGSFLLAAITIRRFRPYAARTAALLGLVVAIAGVYALWQAQAVTLVSDVVADQRARLASIVTTSSLQALLFTPAPALLDEFLLNSEQLFAGLTPLFLFAGPVVLLLFRREPVVWLIVVSTIAYLLVMNVTLLAVPYIYLTYFEILFTPVRNVIFFVYLFAGVLIYAGVVALARLDRTRLLPIVGGTVAGGLALLVALSINQTAAGFVLPLIAAYVFAFLLATDTVRLKPDTTYKSLGRRLGFRTAAAAVLVAAGLLALLPEREPAARRSQVAVRWGADLSDEERAGLEQKLSLTGGEPNSNRTATVNVWNYAIGDTSGDNVRALVTDPRVVDTGGIERDTFTVPPQPPPQDDPYLAVERIPAVQYPGTLMFVAAALFVWAIGFLTPAVLASPRGQRVVAAIQAARTVPFYRHVVPYACFMIPFALWTARPTLSPLSAGDAPNLSTPAALIAGLPCLTTEARPAPFSEDLLDGEAVMLPQRTSCPPAPSLIEWIRSHVPADAVFAIDRWNPYLPSVFVPQQVVVYPQVEVTFENEEALFGRYYDFYAERFRTSRVQPFFNSVETPADRAAFIKALGVTHVLVDPAYYQEMRGVLDAAPSQFALRYTGGEWAVYEVLPARPGAAGV